MNEGEWTCTVQVCLEGKVRTFGATWPDVTNHKIIQMKLANLGKYTERLVRNPIDKLG